jgi:hypothetical protein
MVQILFEYLRYFIFKETDKEGLKFFDLHNIILLGLGLLE